jgi:uncharacterized glyoxalase superfamily protein PhnB
VARARLAASAPVLLVKDLPAVLAYYRDVLGFSSGPCFGEPPSFVILDRDGLRLMLRQAEDPRHVVPHWTVSPKLCDAYFWVSDANALHAEFVARGAKIDYSPRDQPYGCREFGIQDADGHDIAFGQPISEPLPA